MSQDQLHKQFGQKYTALPNKFGKQVKLDDNGKLLTNNSR
jgi:hypothetical protein